MIICSLFLLFCLARSYSFVIQTQLQRVRLSNNYERKLLYYRLPSTENGNGEEISGVIPKLNFNEDYYSVLEVDPNIAQNLLKKAYYKMVFKYHPDNKVGSYEKDLCNRQMMVINGAYKILKNPETRTAYDKKRKLKSGKVKSNQRSIPFKKDNKSPPSSSSWYSTTSGNNVIDSDDQSEPVESLFDILNDMFVDVQNNRGGNVLRDITDFFSAQEEVCV